MHYSYILSILSIVMTPYVCSLLTAKRLCSIHPDSSVLLLKLFQIMIVRCYNILCIIICPVVLSYNLYSIHAMAVYTTNFPILENMAVGSQNCLSLRQRRVLLRNYGIYYTQNHDVVPIQGTQQPWFHLYGKLVVQP